MVESRARAKMNAKDFEGSRICKVTVPRQSHISRTATGSDFIYRSTSGQKAGHPWSSVAGYSPDTTGHSTFTMKKTSPVKVPLSGQLRKRYAAQKGSFSKILTFILPENPDFLKTSLFTPSHRLMVENGKINEKKNFVHISTNTCYHSFLPSRRDIYQGLSRSNQVPRLFTQRKLPDKEHTHKTV